MGWNAEYTIMIDPMRIAEFHFGGPHFKQFRVIHEHRVKCEETGGVWDIRGLPDACAEGRNLMPIIAGPGRHLQCGPRQ